MIRKSAPEVSERPSSPHPLEEKLRSTPDKETHQYVNSAIVQALSPVIERIKRSGNREAVKLISPTLLVAGISLLVQELGRDGAIQVIKALVERIKRGAFDNPLVPPSSSMQ